MRYSVYYNNEQQDERALSYENKFHHAPALSLGATTVLTEALVPYGLTVTS